MENIGSMRPLGWPTMNARGGGSLFSGGRTRAVGHGATPGGADFRLTNRRVELEGVGARRVDAAAQPPQRVLGPAKSEPCGEHFLVQERLCIPEADKGPRSTPLWTNASAMCCRCWR